ILPAPLQLPVLIETVIRALHIPMLVGNHLLYLFGVAVIRYHCIAQEALFIVFLIYQRMILIIAILLPAQVLGSHVEVTFLHHLAGQRLFVGAVQHLIAVSVGYVRAGAGQLALVGIIIVLERGVRVGLLVLGQVPERLNGFFIAAAALG